MQVVHIIAGQIFGLEIEPEPMQEVVVTIRAGNPLAIPEVAVEVDGEKYEGGHEWEMGGPFATRAPGWKITVEREADEPVREIAPPLERDLIAPAA